MRNQEQGVEVRRSQRVRETEKESMVLVAAGVGCRRRHARTKENINNRAQMRQRREGGEAQAPLETTHGGWPNIARVAKPRSYLRYRRSFRFRSGFGLVLEFVALEGSEQTATSSVVERRLAARRGGMRQEERSREAGERDSAQPALNSGARGTSRPCTGPLLR